MSKSLLAVDRQPNGPQHSECGRVMEEDEKETKGKHKGTNFYMQLFLLPRQKHPQLENTKEIHQLAKTLLTTFHSALAAPVVGFPFFMLCFVVETREKWLMNRSTPQPSLLSLTNIGGTRKYTKA